MFSLAKELLQLREQKENLSNNLKDVNAEIEKIEQELIAEMLVEEIGKFSLEGRTYSILTRCYASPKATCKEEFYRWLKTNGYADMVKETVNANTLSAWVKEMTEEEELPEDAKSLLNVYEKQSISIRR